MAASTYTVFSKPEDFNQKVIFDEFYLENYKLALTRIQKVADNCLVDNNGKFALENQLRALVDQYQPFGLQKTAEAVRDYVFKVHQDAWFDVDVFYTSKNTTGYAVGGPTYVLAETKNITAVAFYIAKKNDKEEYTPVPESTVSDAKKWMQSLVTSKEMCKIGYERKFLLYKKTVNVCHDEFTPNLSMRRAFQHQKHYQGINCVIGFVSVSANNTLYNWAGNHMQSTNFEKGKKNVRVVISPEACNMYLKNTRYDENGELWKDDDWIKSEET